MLTVTSRSAAAGTKVPECCKFSKVEGDMLDEPLDHSTSASNSIGSCQVMQQVKIHLLLVVGFSWLAAKYTSLVDCTALVCMLSS